MNKKCISNQLPGGVGWACHAVCPRGCNVLDSIHLLPRGLDFVFRAGLHLGGTYYGMYRVAVWVIFAICRTL